MRYRFIILVLSVVIFGCESKNSESELGGGISISGRVNYPENGLILLEQLSGYESIPIDTFQLADDNTFKKRVELPTAGFYRLNFYNKQALTVILNQDDVSVIVDGNAPTGFFEINGSSEMDAIKTFNEAVTSEFGSRENEMSSRFVTARNQGDSELMRQIQNEYMGLNNEKVEYTKDYIRNLGTSLANTQLVGQLDNDAQFLFKDSVISLLAIEYPNEPNIKALTEQMDKLRVLSPGNMAPEISLPNPDGEIVSLSSFKGKVVLVDFWAEWCKPCRMENPNIVKAYNTYKDKGFDILGVSLDRTRDRWLKGIREDGLVWNHVSDLKYWNSAAAKTYNITAIPFSILVDEDGKIIAKNLRGEALQNKLAEIFENRG